MISIVLIDQFFFLFKVELFDLSGVKMSHINDFHVEFVRFYNMNDSFSCIWG